MFVFVKLKKNVKNDHTKKGKTQLERVIILG